MVQIGNHRHRYVDLVVIRWQQYYNSNMKATNVRVSKLPPPFYTSLDLAWQVREQTTSLINNYSAAKKGFFEDAQISSMLSDLIQADKTQLLYVTSNMFRYDKDKNGVISNEELINFFLEVSWGEIAIQRLHRKGYYKNGGIRMIDADEFLATMNYILNFIKLQTSQDQCMTIFKDVDTNGDGLISYNEYFTFLRTYFGSQSQVFNENEKKKLEKPYLPPDLEVDCRDRLRRLVLTQSRLIFIGYNVGHNLKFTKEEAKVLIHDIFKVENAEEVVERIWTLREHYFADFENFVCMVVMLQFAEFCLGKSHQQGAINTWQERKIGCDDFVKVLRAGCSYMNVQPEREFLQTVYNWTQPDGKSMTYKDYRELICQLFAPQPCDSQIIKVQLIDPVLYLRRAIPTPAKYTPCSTYVSDLWKSLEVVFKKHDTMGTGVTKEPLGEIVTTLFKDLSDHERNVLVWSALNNADGSSIKFEQFGLWAFRKLFHYGALEYFGSQDSSRSLKLDANQFHQFLKGVFRFASPQTHADTSALFDSLAKGEGYVDHTRILLWVRQTLSLRA